MDGLTVIYARISRDRQGAGLGVDRQERECRDLATRSDLNVDLVLKDNDTSAYSGKARPGYERLLELLRSGQVGALLVWHNDRLHRRPIELEQFIDILDQHPARVLTVAAGDFDLSTPAGRMQARMLGTLARYESEQKSSRLRSKSSEIAAAGRYGGGVRPFGFEADGVTVRAEEAHEVVMATSALLAGSSLRDVARDLNQRGVLTSLGKAWSPNQVKSLVLRARNAGLRQHRGEIIGKAAWPAIVDEADWRAASAFLSAPERRTTTTNARKYLLSGIATCAECDGGTIIAKWVSSRGRKRTVYECRYNHCVARASHHVDDLVSETVVAVLSREDARDLLGGPVDDDGSADQAESDALQARLDDVAKAYAAGAVTIAQLTTITETCRARLETLQARAVASAPRPIFATLVGADDVRAAWALLSLAQKRAIIDSLMTVQLRKTARRGPGFDPASVLIAPR